MPSLRVPVGVRAAYKPEFKVRKEETARQSLLRIAKHRARVREFAKPHVERSLSNAKLRDIVKSSEGALRVPEGLDKKYVNRAKRSHKLTFASHLKKEAKRKARKAVKRRLRKMNPVRIVKRKVKRKIRKVKKWLSWS